MNRRLDDLIPLALDAAKKHLERGRGFIPSEYNGYIASFGASVIQAGLKPAVAFNERKSESSSEDKRPLMRAILHILLAQGKGNDGKLADDASLLSHILQRPEEERQLKRRILDAATALKLAIRTFRLEKKGASS